MTATPPGRDTLRAPEHEALQTGVRAYLAAPAACDAERLARRPGETPTMP